MTKHAVVLQYQEDWPGNPGWWRYSRPVLRHLTLVEIPEITETSRIQYVTGCREARQLQQDWDKKYPN